MKPILIVEESLKIRYFDFNEEAIVIAQAGVNFGINSTRCSDDGKTAFGCASCNFIAVFATTCEIYPKFHSFPCYYIY